MTIVLGRSSTRILDEASAEREPPRGLLETAIGSAARGLAREMQDPRRRAFWAGWFATWFLGCARGIRKGSPGPLGVVILAELGGLAAAKAWDIAQAARQTAATIETIGAAAQAATQTAERGSND